MLDGMRKASRGWLGRIVMAVIMAFISLSFVVWGVGDIFRGFGDNTVATVGKATIPAEALRNAYQTQLQEMQRQQRRAITNDQARAMGLDSQVLSKLVADAALDDRTRQLGLAMSDADIAKTILTDATFAGPGGKFDPGRFAEILRDNGFSERSFATEQRKVYLRQEFVDALAANLQVPAAYLDAVHRYRAETRSIDTFTLPASAAGDIAAPEDATLQSWFDARKQTFRSPEYRGLVTLSVTPATIANPDIVTDADVAALYDREGAKRFGSPEKRQLSQALFADEKSATEAAAKIAAGATLEGVAAEYKTSVVPLGEVTRGELFDKAIADAGFALAAGQTSDPVKGQFGYALVRAEKITAAAIKPLSEVAGEVRKEIALERAGKFVREIHDRIEDERTSGKTLAEAAGIAGVTPIQIAAIDAQGRDREGREIEILSERDALLRAVFNSDVGVDNDTLSTHDGGYIWFEVTAVEKAHERTLAEVRDKAIAGWRDDETDKRLAAKASELVGRIDAGETVEAVAKAAGDLEVKNIGDVRRVETNQVSPGVVARVFSTPVGKTASALGEAHTRIVFKVLDANTPVMDADTDVNKGVAQQLRTSVADDILVQYLAKLQGELRVTINQTAARVATGGSAEPN